MELVLSMYVTLVPAIFAGVLNMIWCKLPILSSLNKPIDNGVCLSDGRRLFGDNKTWKGIVGYLLLNTLCMVLWGLLCSSNLALSSRNFFYLTNSNTIGFNQLIGVFLGLGYSLFELPNSFMKRRLGVEPGKTKNGFWKVFFVILDQADSIFGCVLVVAILYPMSIGFYLLYVALGALTHIVFNMLLYFAHLRKNMF